MTCPCKSMSGFGADPPTGPVAAPTCTANEELYIVDNVPRCVCKDDAKMDMNNFGRCYPEEPKKANSNVPMIVAGVGVALLVGFAVFYKRG